MHWIKSVCTWVPQRYSQDELLTALGLAGNRFAARIFAKTAVEFRHVMQDPAQPFASHAHLRFPRPEEICRHLLSSDHVIEVSNLERPRYQLPTASHSYLQREWCPGSIRALELATQLNGLSSVLTVDVNSLLRWQPDFRDANDIIAFALFGDGIACVEVVDQPSTTRIVGFSYLHNDAVDLVRYEEGRLLLSRDLPRRAPPLIEDCIKKLLGEHGLVVEDIAHWIVHPGGRKVLDCLGVHLGIESRLHHSREILRKYGNVGASSLFFVLKTVMESNPAAGSYGVMIGFGPGTFGGFSVGSCLIQW